MKKITPTQQCLKELYGVFKKICDKYNISFCGVAGTALGAVRHGGFIPWDDDIDLGMPIEDFEYFKKICKTELPDYIGFSESLWMGGKIYDKRTTVIDTRFLTQPDKYCGIYLDIFPMIGTPDDEGERLKFTEDILNFQKNAQLFEWYPEISTFSKNDLLKWRNCLIKAYDYKTSKKVAGFCYFLYDGSGFRNPKEMIFEDTKIPISSSYDIDLKNHFGDYMKLPPESQQKTHDEYHLIDLNKSFMEYVDDFTKVSPWLRDILIKKHINEGKLMQLSNSLEYNMDEKNKLLNKITNDIKNIKSSRAYKISNRISKSLYYWKKK